MKTNKINVVLSLNKSTVASFNGDEYTPVSGAACTAGGGPSNVTACQAAKSAYANHAAGQRVSLNVGTNCQYWCTTGKV